MNVKKLSWFLGGLTAPDAFTNPQGQRVVWAIGDSLMIGSGATAGPTLAAGVGYQWDYVTTNTIVPILSGDIIGASSGSWWPQTCQDYYNNNAGLRKLIIVNSGVSGSELIQNPAEGAASNFWSGAGTGTNIYATQKAKVDACIAAAGVQKLYRIYICLGINDSRGTATIGTVTAAQANFIAQLITDYPDTEIRIINIGRKEASISDTRTLQIRIGWRLAAQNNTKVSIAGNLCNYVNWAMYQGDNLHITQAANNQQGSQIARFEKAFDLGYNKWACGVIAQQYTAVSTAREQLISTFFNSLTAAQWDKIPSFHFGKANETESVRIAWGMLNESYTGGYGFTANSHFTSNGTSSYFQDGYPPSNAPFASLGQNNLAYTAWVKTIRSNDGTTRRLFGTTNGTVLIQVSQTVGTNINYSVQNASTEPYTGETKFADESDYTIDRTASGAVHLKKDGVTVDTGTQTSNGFTTRVMTWGCLDSNGTPNAFIDADFYAVMTHSSDIDYSIVRPAVQALIDGW